MQGRRVLGSGGDLLVTGPSDRLGILGCAGGPKEPGW